MQIEEQKRLKKQRMQEQTEENLEKQAQENEKKLELL
jgi:hypothetical protein